MSKNIYIVTSNFPPVNIVGALRPFRLAKHIGKHGWKPVIVSFLPKRIVPLDYTLLRELTDDTEICYVDKRFTNYDSIKISELPKILDKYCNDYKLTSLENNNREFVLKVKKAVASQLKRWIKPDPDVVWVLSIIRKILSRINYNERNIILTTSPPHSLHIAGLFLKRRQGLSWVVDFRDPFDPYTVSGSYNIVNPINRYIEKNIINTADAIISTTRTATHVLRERHSCISSKKFHTITNSYDKDKVKITSKKSHDKYIICYTGIFYPDKDPYTFFRALRTWFDSMDNKRVDKYFNRLEVQLIGSKDKTTQKMVSDLGLKNTVCFIDQVSHLEAIRLTKGADMVLISSGLGIKTRPGWLPSKMFEYLGCRLPILAIIREGEMADILCKTNAGYVITSENHIAIHRILEYEISKKFSTDQSNKYVNQFTFDNIEQFEEENVFNQMINVIENVSK